MAIRARLAIVAVPAAGVAVAAGYFLWPSDSRKASCPRAVLAPVSAAAKTTIGGYARRIHHTVDRSNDGTRDESWSDSLTGRTREVSFDRDGKITDQMETTRKGTLERTEWVIYDGRSWSTSSDRLPSPLQDDNGAAATVARVRQEIASGRTVVVGRAVVHGRETLHLHEVLHLPKMTLTPRALGLPKGMRLPKALNSPRVLRFDTWVDPSTYLPLRRRMARKGNWSVTEETWLPRTNANLAKLRFVVPHGFEHVVEHPGMSTNLTLVGGGQIVSSVPATLTRCRQS